MKKYWNFYGKVILYEVMMSIPVFWIFRRARSVSIWKGMKSYVHIEISIGGPSYCLINVISIDLMDQRQDAYPYDRKLSCTMQFASLIISQFNGPWEKNGIR